MDASTQFVLIAKRVLRELRALREAISAGFLGVQKQVEAIGKHKQSEKTADDKPLSPIVSVLTTPTAIKVKAETHDNKDKWQRVFEILELLGIAAVVAYALLTYYQLKELRKSVDATQQTATFAYHQTILAGNSLKATIENFRSEQRPWVGAEKVDVTGQLPGGPIKVNVEFINSGKTPALDQHLALETDCRPIGEKPRIKYSERVATDRGTIMPNQHFSGGIEDQPVCSTQNVELLRQGKATIFVVGTLWYKDEFKTSHTTDFCFYGTIPKSEREKKPGEQMHGEIHPCLYHNQAD